MKKILEECIKKIEVLNPTNHELPIVISITHSGVYILNNMSDKLVDDIILPNMDWYLPKLYFFIEELGFTTIINNISRYVIDPNREIEGKKSNSSYVNTLVYTRTTFGKNMYKEEIDSQEIDYRINEFYIPYHQALKDALKDKLKHFKKVYLMDLHSFGKNENADIVLGNNEGKTTSDTFIEFIKKSLENEGFTVKCNKPYKGGYITKFYGNEIDGCEALQIELSYQTYIDKRNFGEEELPDINEIVFFYAQAKMKKIFSDIRDKFLQNK